MSAPRDALAARLAAVALVTVALPAAALAAPGPAPPLRVLVDGDVDDAAAVREAFESALARIDAEVRRLAGGAPLRHRLAEVRVRRAFALAPHKAASSRPGVTELRAATTLDQRARAALAHEAAHQILWSVCPAVSADALFHEAFAVWASDEAPLWLDDEDYLSLPRARELLDKNPIDSRAARRALARLVSEEHEAPRALASRLRACADGATVPPLAVAELAAHAAEDVDVTVVLQRATGEIVTARGDATRPLPFGSTLKPFLVAAARMGQRPTPKLPPRATDPLWACHQSAELRTLDERDALLLSCNGWFMDWAGRDGDVAHLGELGPLLLDYGLSALPADMPQAIGLQAKLTLPPLGLARAYRALSFARPDVLELLEDNAKRGTLAGAEGLRGVATKTGTVRGLGSAPDLGWLVAVNDDVVVVRARSGVVPQALVDDVVDTLQKLPRAARTVAVQTFGLLPADQPRARCPSRGFVVSSAAAGRAGATATALARLTRQGAALCDEAWELTLDETRTRPYLGVFTWQPPGEAAPTGGTARQERARRGADFILHTSLGRYAASVLQAEDAEAAGAARDALARVIAHNVLHPEERHAGRPLCDTTHCQVFLGTAAAPLGASSLEPLAARSFLMFSKGGMQPWRQSRSLAQWRAALAAAGVGESPELRVVGVRGDQLALLVRSVAGDAEEAMTLSCEGVRNALALPSCPSRILVEGTQVRFEGAGAGHGRGLDVERAKDAARAGQSAEQILRAAYGASITAP